MMRHSSMAKKLPAFALLTSFLFGVLGWLLLHGHSQDFTQQATDAKRTAIMQRLLDRVPPAVLNEDSISIQVALQNATRDPLVHRASYFDKNGILKAQSDHSEKPASKSTVFTQPIEIQNVLAGQIQIELDQGQINATYSRIVIDWLLLWSLFSGVITYFCYRWSARLSLRIKKLTHRLPGNESSIEDEIIALEQRLEPLLALSNDTEIDSAHGYYCSLLSVTFLNRQRLTAQLNRENMDLLFEKIDYCTLRTLELYGGQRIEGADGIINFYIRSTQCSKQHILVCLMAVYSLQQLLERLAHQMSIDLEMAWTVCSGNVVMVPVFRYHEKISELKKLSLGISEKLQDGMIVVRSDEYDSDQLSTIAHFVRFDSNCYLLQAFSEERQMLLEKQIQHLASICLYHNTPKALLTV